MKITFLLIISVALISCQNNDKVSNQIECSTLSQLNNDLEKEIEISKNITGRIQYFSSRNSISPLAEENTRFHALRKSIIINCDSLHKTIPVGDSIEISKWIEQLHANLDEMYSIYEIKFYIHMGLTPHYDIGHYEITELIGLIGEDCIELIHLKINRLQNKFFNNIRQIMTRHMDRFNKHVPIAYSKESIINVGDTLELFVGFLGFDSTDFHKVKYWIDDSTMNPNTEVHCDMQQPLRLGGSKGKHIVYGAIQEYKGGFLFWRPWKYEYVVR